MLRYRSVLYGTTSYLYTVTNNSYHLNVCGGVPNANMPAACANAVNYDNNANVPGAVFQSPVHDDSLCFRLGDADNVTFALMGESEAPVRAVVLWIDVRTNLLDGRWASCVVVHRS